MAGWGQDAGRESSRSGQSRHWAVSGRCAASQQLFTGLRGRSQSYLAASTHGKKPVTNFSCFPHMQTSALVTHSRAHTMSHLLFPLLSGKVTEGSWGGTVGWEVWGWSSSDEPQPQSSTVHRQLQELQMVAAAITPMIFDLC